MLPARGYTFIGLNILRLLSIVAILLVFASSVVILVHDIQTVSRFIADGKAAAAAARASGNSTIPLVAQEDYLHGSSVPNQPAGAFWAVLNRLLIIFQTIVLLLSEFGWPARVFDRFFPVLGSEFGLGSLGIIQCLIGAAILSHHVDKFNLVAAFFLFSVGCLNIIFGLIFRESAKAKRSLMSWREPKEELLPPVNGKGKGKGSGFLSSSSSLARSARSASPTSNPPSFHSTLDEKSAAWVPETGKGKPGFGFGRQGEKAAALKGYLVSKPVETLPRYAPKASANKDRGRRYSTSSSIEYSSSSTAA